MATSRVSPDWDSITCEVHIARPPERVFGALTAQSYRGWPRRLGWLEALLEPGETAANRNRRAAKTPGSRRPMPSARASSHFPVTGFW